VAETEKEETANPERAVPPRTARARALTVLGVCLAGVGAYLAAGHGTSSFGYAWIRVHLDIVESQLADLKDLLLDYKKTHGRYPTNDEGLAALDNFESRFRVTLPITPGQAPGQIAGLDPRLDYYFHFMARQVLKLFRDEKGRAPRNEAEFRDVLPEDLVSRLLGGNAQEAQVEIAITRSDNVLILSPAGVLSPWFIPYMYENRNGLDASAFADSPAERDKRAWCVARVDEGVYVCSIGAQLRAREHDEAWWAFNGPRLLGVGLLLLALGCFAAVMRSPWRRAAKGAAAILVSGALGFLTSKASQVSCYAMVPFFHTRQPEIVAQQRKLLKKYRRRGVLAEATYAKALEALEGPLEAGKEPR